MVRFFIGLGVVALGLLIYCTVECIQTPRRRVRVLPKAAWFFIILLLPLLGPGLWMAFGRAKDVTAAPRRKGPAAPDDDPEFLRRVEIERRQHQRREQETQKKAEEARKRREADEQKANEPGSEQSNEQGSDSTGADAATGESDSRSSEDPRASDDDESEGGPDTGPTPQRG